jgi:hypothetical protein
MVAARSVRANQGSQFHAGWARPADAVRQRDAAILGYCHKNRAPIIAIRRGKHCHAFAKSGITRYRSGAIVIAHVERRDRHDIIFTPQSFLGNRYADFLAGFEEDCSSQRRRPRRSRVGRNIWAGACDISAVACRKSPPSNVFPRREICTDDVDERTGAAVDAVAARPAGGRRRQIHHHPLLDACAAEHIPSIGRSSPLVL